MTFIMNNEIPAEFWMIIISILTAALVYILYYVANTFKQLSATLEEVSEVVATSNEIVLEAKEIVTDVRTVIINPLLKIGSVIQSISRLAEKFPGAQNN